MGYDGGAALEYPPASWNALAMNDPLARILASIAFLGATVLGAAAHAADARSTVGTQRIDDFTLNDFLGAKRSLSEWKNRPVMVVVFLGTECPLAKLYGRKLAELDRQFGDKGVQFLGVNSNRQDTLQEIAGYAKKHGIEFPLLKDAGTQVADQFGATRTPEAFVLDGDRTIRYRGRIDDQYGVGAARKKTTKTELLDAVEALLAGRTVEVAETPAIGCIIGRREPSQAVGAVTYTKHIVPLLQERCVGCHREGQIGPFTLTEYADVAAWADMCLEVIDEGRMPPWQADPAHGEFLNDARLSPEEKTLFRQWVEAGVPEGDPADCPSRASSSTVGRFPSPTSSSPCPRSSTCPPRERSTTSISTSIPASRKMCGSAAPKRVPAITRLFTT